MKTPYQRIGKYFLIFHYKYIFFLESNIEIINFTKPYDLFDVFFFLRDILFI